MQKILILTLLCFGFSLPGFAAKVLPCGIAIDNKAFLEDSRIAGNQPRRSRFFLHVDFVNMRQLNKEINKERVTKIEEAYKEIFFKRLAQNENLGRLIPLDSNNRPIAYADYKSERSRFDLINGMDLAFDSSGPSLLDVFLALQSIDDFINLVAKDFEANFLEREDLGLTADQKTRLIFGLERAHVAGVAHDPSEASTIARHSRNLKNLDDQKAFSGIKIAYFDFNEVDLIKDLFRMKQIVAMVRQNLGWDINTFMSRNRRTGDYYFNERTIEVFKKVNSEPRRSDTEYDALIEQTFVSLFGKSPDHETRVLMVEYLHLGDPFIPSLDVEDTKSISYGSKGDGAKFITHLDIRGVGIKNATAALAELDLEAVNARKSVARAKASEKTVTNWLNGIKNQISNFFKADFSGDDGVEIFKNEYNAITNQVQIFDLFSTVEQKRVRISILDGGSRGLSLLDETTRAGYFNEIEALAKKTEWILDEARFSDLAFVEGIAVRLRVDTLAHPFEIQLYGKNIDEAKLAPFKKLVEEQAAPAKVKFVPIDERNINTNGRRQSDLVGLP